MTLIEELRGLLAKQHASKLKVNELLAAIHANPGVHRDEYQDATREFHALTNELALQAAAALPSLLTLIEEAEKRQMLLAEALGYRFGFDLTANDGSCLIQGPDGADLGRFENTDAALARIAELTGEKK